MNIQPEILVFFLGILTAIIGYGVNNFLIKPILDYKKFTTRVGYTLTVYSHIITSPGPGVLALEAHKTIREIACDLEQKYLQVPFRVFFSKVRAITSKRSVIDARGSLISISNNLDKTGRTDENYAAIKNVYTKLNIKELMPRYNDSRK